MRAHHFIRDPGLGLPLLALGINVAVLLWAWQMIMPPAPAPKVALISSGQQTDSAAASVELLTSGEVMINGRISNTPADIANRLQDLPEHQSAVVVRVRESVPSSKLVDLLSQCNQAGFMDLAIAISSDTTRTLAP